MSSSRPGRITLVVTFALFIAGGLLFARWYRAQRQAAAPTPAAPTPAAPATASSEEAGAPTLFIEVSAGGFRVLVDGEALPPQLEACEGTGLTLCVDPARRRPDDPTSGYRWHELYNLALRLKRGEQDGADPESGWAEARRVELTLAPDMPMAFMMQTIETLQAVRQSPDQRQTFDSLEAFERAQVVVDPNGPDGVRPLFPEVVLTHPGASEPER